MRASRVLQSLFRIESYEAHRTLWSFVYLFTAIFAFIVGRISRSTLFLELPNYREMLPLMYIGQAVTVSLAMYGYAHVERRLRRDRTNALTLLGIIAVTFALRLALDVTNFWVLAAYYIWVEVMGTFLIVQFWSFTNEIFHSRQAKRLFAFIGGGGVLSGVVAGFGIGAVVKVLHTENLLFLMCAALGVSFVAVRRLGVDARAELTAALERAPSKSRPGKPVVRGRVFATRHVQLIALVIVVTFLASTLVDYQFNVIVGDAITQKDARSAYFGVFFGVTGVLAGVIQFFLTSRILERFGVLFALVALPASMLVGSTLLLAPAVAALTAVVVAKGAEATLRYSVNDTALQLLYLPVPAQIRGRAKAFIDGILKPVSIGMAGVLLMVLKGTIQDILGVDPGFRLRVEDVSWIVGGTLLVWLGAVVFLRREYLQSLLQTLQRRRLNFADTTFRISDDGTLKTLRHALVSSSMGEVIHALELLPFVAQKARTELDPLVAGLLQHEDEDVRVAALRYLESSGALPQSDRVAELLTDASPDVRAAAVLAFCAMQKERAVSRVLPLLRDEVVLARAAAVAGLVRYGGLDGVLASADVLKAMLSSTQESERERAAWVLGRVGLQNFYQPLVPLLEDSAERVRLAAVEAAGRLASPELIPSLVSQLDRPKLAPAAVASLGAYGPQVQDVASGILSDLDRSAAIKAQACRILARQPDSKSAQILMGHIGHPSGVVRGAVVAALHAVKLASPGVHVDASALRAGLRRESHEAFQWLALVVDLELGDASPLLADALQYRRKQCAQRLFAYLGLLYPWQTIDLVRRNLASAQASTRANAVEVLDNLLDKDDKPYVLPLVEEGPMDRAVQTGASLFTLERHTQRECLAVLMGGKAPFGANAWLQSCAAVCVADLGFADMVEVAQGLLSSSSPVCRQTALYVTHRLQAEGYAKGADAVRDDAHPSVRSYAAYVLEAGAS